jgi:type II secretory pathway predicted ATPase ExeA
MTSNTNHAIDELTTTMFCEHFAFTGLPFFRSVRPEQVFPTVRLESALSRLQMLLTTREIGVVIGESGVGKSTLLDLFLSHVFVSHYRIISLPTSQSKPRELYRAAATALGASPVGANALKIVNLLTHSHMESNRPNLLILDEAQLLSPACLNELRLLSNIQEKHEPLVILILFGQPQLASNLKLPDMAPLAQRISVWITLEGLSEDETCGYIHWQLKNAGAARPEDVFLPAVKTAIHRWTNGTPRKINRAAWECLNQACLEGAHVVTEEIFQTVCKILGPRLT